MTDQAMILVRAWKMYWALNSDWLASGEDRLALAGFTFRNWTRV